MEKRLSKKEYFEALRNRWKEAKEYAERDEIKALFQHALENGLKVSAHSFAFVKKQLDEKGLEGTPYLDTKTFQGWVDNGFKVKKGEKSFLQGITFLPVEREKETGEKEVAYTVPKAYHLFHKSQVEAI